MPNKTLNVFGDNVLVEINMMQGKVHIPDVASAFTRAEVTVLKLGSEVTYPLAVGQQVLVNPQAGIPLAWDGKKLVLLRQANILGAIVEEPDDTDAVN